MLGRFSKSINLFRQNWWLFSLIILTVWLPGSILLVYFRWYVWPEMTGGDEMRMFLKEYRFTQLIDTIFGPFYLGALIYALAQIKQDVMPSYGECMAHAARRSYKLMITRLTTKFIILGGLLLLIVPGVMLGLQYLLIDFVVVLDGIDDNQARKYSAQLTQGKRVELLGTLIIYQTLIILGVALTSALFSIVVPEQASGIFALDVIYECVFQVLTTVILPTILFLFYWESKHQES